MQLEPVLARQIIETLGQFGIPYSKGISFYNAGNSSILETLDKHYLSKYLVEGGAVFKLVVGDYGSGKSHFLYCVRELAWQRRFAVSKIDLSPKEAPYDDQRKVYSAISSELMWHDLNQDSLPEKGLSRLLYDTLAQLIHPLGYTVSDPDSLRLPEVQALLHTLKTTPIDSASYRMAIIAYLEATITNQERRLVSLERWLHGDEVTPEDMRDLRSVGVVEKITKPNAFKMLRSLCQTVRALGYNGLVLLFDEGDRMLSIGGKAEKTATDTLREVIDRCREELPGAMFMYAVPPDFLHTVVPKYPALQQRVQTANYFSRVNPFSPQIDLERLDIPDQQLLQIVGEKLLKVFEIAYDVQFTQDVQLENIRVFAESAKNSYLAVSHRRLFVKALVTEFFRQSQEGETHLTLEEADARIRGQNDALKVIDDSQQAPY